MLAIVTAISVFAGTSPAQDVLESGFIAPDINAKPRTWWHWIDGNVTSDGIRRDLEWMQRSGLGGFQLFDVGRNFPQLVPKPVPFMSDGWFSAIGFAAEEARRLGLEMTMAASPGWSESGGPMVNPEAAMKKLVWSEVEIEGGKTFSGTLPQPPSNNGPYLDLAKKLPFTYQGQPLQSVIPPSDTLYRDIKVIAFKLPGTKKKVDRIFIDTGPVDAEVLTDGSFEEGVSILVEDENQKVWITVDFGEPTEIQSLKLGVEWQIDGTSAMPNGEVTASDDGNDFRDIATLPNPGTAGELPIITLALPPTVARYFRLQIKPNPGFTVPGMLERHVKEIRLSELDFSNDARVHLAEAKAGFSVLSEAGQKERLPFEPKNTIASSDVLDLTDKLSKSGNLVWEVPPGRWKILRFGYSLTGQTCQPATQAGVGFEVDKLSSTEVERFLHAYFDPIIEHAGRPVDGTGLKGILTDSWEAGQANWTPTMPEDFSNYRGYDITRFLPILAGYVVDSSEKTNKFLWDFRRTLADLIADNHYKVIRKFANENDLELYGEAMGTGRPTTGDGLLFKRYTTIPMAEFWQSAPDKPSSIAHISDIKEAASAAHVYGQNIVAAESFTYFPFPGTPDPYTTTPWLLKPLADRFMALGVNRFVIHTSPHQPLEQGPGLTLSMVGQFFTRHETWAEHARGWIDYLARSSYLLQQGKSISDIAYFYGEDIPATVTTGVNPKPEIPAGYDFDYISKDMLLHEFEVMNGRLVAKAGMSYRILVMPEDLTMMSYELISRLKELVEQGVTLVANKPTGSASLQSKDEQVSQIADQLWGNKKRHSARSYGKGQIYWGLELKNVLAKENIDPDIRFTGIDAENIVWLHRSGSDADIYFFANQKDQKLKVNANIRISGKSPEIWYADSALIIETSYRTEGNRTVVPLELNPYEAYFLVFRKETNRQHRNIPKPDHSVLKAINGPWKVSFPPNKGPPKHIRLLNLQSLSDHPEPGVKYFSGVATYETKFDLQQQKPDADSGHIFLNLGIVHETALVKLNGETVGILWKPPFRIDISKFVKTGENDLTIEVANLWPNRFIGDLQDGVSEKFAYSTFDIYWPKLISLPFKKDSELLPSGLVGPVHIEQETN